MLIFSLGFYAWGERELVLLIVLSSVIDYGCGLIIDRGAKKLGLLISIFFNLSILFYFKYSFFIYDNLSALFGIVDVHNEGISYFSKIVLPIGISFYTFQTMSYTIDVYRGRIKANKNFLDFATYVTLFPQLIAGPIVRYSEIEIELKKRQVRTNNFTDGIERFIIGLSKKVIIANNCAFLVDGIFALPVGDMSSLIGWIGIFAFGLQVYFDFSGYSDMAIGLGKMFGFSFPENFNYPYISKSIREVWRRWHITLSSWFKDYLYISLGGSRKGEMRTYLNLFIVFFLTGLWHGANWNFIVWGCIHGLFIIIEKLGLNRVLDSINGKISNIYMLFVFFTSLVFIRCNDLTHSLEYLINLFSFKIETNVDFLSFYLTKEIFVVLIIGTLFCTPVHRNIKNKIKVLNLGLVKHRLLSGTRTAVLFALLFVSFLYIAKGSYNPFIYFKF